MAITVIERVDAFSASAASFAATTTVTPVAGDVLVAVVASSRGTARVPVSISGGGATWASAYAGARHHCWIGTAPTAAGPVTVNMDDTGVADVVVYLVRGLASTAVAASQVVGTASGAVTGPSLTAEAGQIAIAAALSTTSSSVLVFPTTQTPAGWTTFPVRDRGAPEYADAYRIPDASATHRVDSSTSTTGARSDVIFVIGASAGGPTPATATLAGALRAKTATFTIGAVVGVALSATLKPKAGAFALTAPGIPEEPPADGEALTLGGELQRKIATFIAKATVPVTPAPAPLVMAGQSMVVAEAFGAVTMQGTQPIYSTAHAAAPRGRQRILVDGVDVTYFRGGITPDVTYTLVEPLLYGPGTLELPQVSACFERLGVGELSWLRVGKTVQVDRVVDDVVVGTDYKGVIVAFDTAGRNLSVELGGEATGRAALRNRQVPIFPRRNDIGHQIDDAVRDLGLPTLPHLGPVTGIEVMTSGGTGHLEHIQQLVSKAFTKAGRQWTVMPDADGIYRTKRKDVETIHATAFTDDAHTVANLRRDVAEEPNRIFGTGVTPAGQRVRNGVYPGLIQGNPPPFPGPMQDGDTGEGVRLLIGRLQAVGYIGLRDVEGGYDDDVHDAVVELQTDAGFFDDGFGTTDPGWVDEKTWRALYDLDVTGASLEWAHIEPMAQRRKVRKWNRSGSGTITKLNPVYDPEALVVDRNIDYGPGLKRRQMFNRSKAELHDSDEPNWVGDITFHAGALLRGNVAIGATPTAADVMDARELKPGMNLSLPMFDGGIVVHVSACQIDAEGTVTATVDTRFRDSMEVWEVIARNKESRNDPGRVRDQRQRSSTIVKDSIGEWDEIGGLLGNDVDLEPGWNVVRVVGAAEGTIARIRLLVQTVTSDGGAISVEPHEFACAVFGKEVGRGDLTNLVPAPLTVEGSKAWEKRADALEGHWLLYAAGTHDEPCGYSPGRKHFKSVTTEEPNPDYDPATDPDSDKVITVTTEESWGVLTGKHVDDASFAYRSEERTWLYVAVWVAKPTTLHAGRIMWPQLEAGV